MTRVQFLPAARSELRRAVERYDAELPGLGGELIAEVERVVGRIKAFPEHGTGYFAGTRRVILRRFPFSIVYRLDPSVILIVALAHHRRRPGYWGRRT